MSTETLIQKYPLKREKIIKKSLSWLIFPIIIAIVLTAVAILISSILILGIIVLMGILFAIVYWYELQYFNSYFYDLTDEGIVVSKGVFSTHRVIVPPQKVQDVYLDQDYLDRLFGLWDLHISSATGTSGTQAHIDGVSEEDGRKLREVLMGSFVKEKISDKILKQILPSKMGIVSLLAGGAFGFVIAFMFFGYLAVLFIPIGLVLAYLDFTVLRYELRENGVFVRRGFINRSENLFLYKNIQDVEEIANFWDRILGLKTLSIKTMTESSATGALMTYITADKAPVLREEIIGKAKKASEKKEIKVDAKTRATKMKMGIETAPEKERPEVSEKDMPYPYHFYKGAAFSSLEVGLWGLLALCFLLVFFVLLGNIALFFLVLLIALGLFVLASVGNFFFALINELSYKYKITSDFILIKTGIFNIVKKQINYNKMQDLEKRISFSQSFAKLATLKLETGSKEIIGSGNKQRISHAVTQNETIPDLSEEDAEKLKRTILTQMEISLEGIGRNPLVSQLPLETVKPLKKTMWWIIYSAITVCVVSVLLLLFAKQFLWFAGLLFTALMVACIVKYIYEYYYYKSYFYDVNDDVLIVKKGVFGSRELVIPFEKIQDVFVDRDWLDLAFGLYDVYVSTVSSRSILNAHIDGLNKGNASEAALVILKKIRGG